MKIGIDAKWYFEGPPSGKIVIQNLVDNIIKFDGTHEYFIYLDKKYIGKKFPFHNANVQLRYIWAKNNLISNMVALPMAAGNDNVDVVVFQNFSSLFGKYKKIAYIHDILYITHPQYYTFIEKVYFIPLKYLANQSDHICTVSETEKIRLKQNIFRKPISVVYHGVDIMFKPLKYYEKNKVDLIKQKYNLPDQYLLFVGRLNTRKNILNLLKAFRLIKKNIKLVIVGSKDWKMFDLDKLLETMDIKDKIIFTGFVCEDDLPVIYSLSNIFCFPSFAEGFGLPPLEAMASGVPVVVSNATCLPEICDTAGSYVDPNDPIHIADTIRYLLENESVRKEKILLGMNRAKEFTWKKSAHTLIDLCEKVVAT